MAHADARRSSRPASPLPFAVCISRTPTSQPAARPTRRAPPRIGHRRDVRRQADAAGVEEPGPAAGDEVEDAAPLLEEAALLGVEQREAVEVHLLVVRLHLGEVGVGGEVERQGARQRVADVQPHLLRPVGLAADAAAGRLHLAAGAPQGVRGDVDGRAALDVRSRSPGGPATARRNSNLGSIAGNVTRSWLREMSRVTVSPIDHSARRRRRGSRGWRTGSASPRTSLRR